MSFIDMLNNTQHQHALYMQAFFNHKSVHAYAHEIWKFTKPSCWIRSSQKYGTAISHYHDVCFPSAASSAAVLLACSAPMTRGHEAKLVLQIVFCSWCASN